MNTLNALSIPGKITIVGLLVAAAGISTLFLTNSVTVPAVAVGPILLLLTSALMAFGPWRWTSIVAVLLSLFIIGGAFIAPGLFDRLGDPSRPGAFIGTWVQMLGLLTALVAGILTTMHNFKPRTHVTGR